MSLQHVLIVDDRPTNRNIFAKLAGSLSPEIRVETFGEPRAALESLDRLTPDLIIVDFSMPEMNGAEFTRAVRARAATHDVPVIVVTAHDDRDFRLSALEAGASDFLQSPIDRTEFRKRVRALLLLREQQQRLSSTMAALGSARWRRTGAELLAGQANILGQVLDNVAILISAVDLDGACLFVNARFAAFFGTTPDQLVGANLVDVMGMRDNLASRRADQRVLETGNAVPPYEEILKREGASFSYLVLKAPLRDAEGRVVGILTSGIDITARKAAETHLAHIARHDALTGLPNRTMYRDRLHAQIAREGRATLFLIDLDRFKFINDTRGHRAGDQLLERVAERIAGTLGPNDSAARLGGDEFAVIAAGVGDEAAAATRAAGLIAALSRTYRLDHHDLVLSASVGISMAPRDGATPDELLRTADLAMYEAKAAGGNGYRFFNPEMNRRAQDAATLEAELHLAIERGEFMAHYQPMIEARTGEVVSAEALLRWAHPTRGLLAPAAFLPAAEETGLVIPIGHWMLREACRRQVRWQAEGVPVPRVSVNLSALQFQREDMAHVIASVIAETGISPGALEIEIVESVLLTNRAAVADTLREIRAMGVRVAIDDFGTGYSSLQYLRDLPVDMLKIDRSFVSGLPESAKDAAIIAAITGLAHDLGLEIVAEGVETEDQELMLRTIGCDRLQGYHLQRPCAAGMLARSLTERRAMELEA